MKFFRNSKEITLHNLVVTYHIMIGFNAFYLIEVLHEAMTYKYSEKNIQEFIEMMDIHYHQGIATKKFNESQFSNTKIKDNLLSDEIINYYILYKESLAYLVKEYKVDVDGVISFFKQLYYAPDDRIDFMDYVQAHRWLSSALSYHAGKSTKAECYEKFYRVDALSNYEELLSMSEVEKFAENIHHDFIHIVEKRKTRSKRSGNKKSLKKKNVLGLKVEV